MTDLRIVSFLPSATEMLVALGLGEALVGISHECDFPKEIRDRPVVVRAALDTNAMGSLAIDEAVRERVAAGKSLYIVDEAKLRELAPTHIITQDLCNVCAPSGQDIAGLLAKLPGAPKVISLSPRTLNDIVENLRELGNTFDRHNEAEVLLIEWKARMDDLRDRVGNMPYVKCFVMEWVEPIYCTGHWVAEMVQMAGGYDLLARPGQDSVKITWDEVRAAAPDVLILAPCGMNVDQAADLLPGLTQLPGWDELPAVQAKRVYAVNANAFITRPGPRVVDGVEMLAYLLHQ